MSDSFIVRSTDLRKGPPPAPIEPEPLCHPADLVGCEQVEGQTFRVIGQVRFLGPKTNMSPLLKRQIFDWQTVDLYEVPAGMKCDGVAMAEQSGRMTSHYTGDSGWNVMNTLNMLMLPEINRDASAEDFIRKHACGCPLCWNTLYQTRSHWDCIEAERNTAFTKKWWSQKVKDTVIGGAILYKLRKGQ